MMDQLEVKLYNLILEMNWYGQTKVGIQW